MFLITAAIDCTIDEIFTGAERAIQRIMVDGVAGAGDMWTEETKASRRRIPLEISSESVALTIATAELEPRYQTGDIVYGTKTAGGNLHNFLGRDCIILTADGDKLVKYLTKGSRSNVFTLKSVKMVSPPDDMVDVKITWAAPIELIVRGR